MKIHEYQAKEILRRFNVAVPEGRVATTPKEAAAIARELGSKVVIKAQIHAGGRGKGGGIKLADSIEEAEQLASEILGMQLVTPQTSPSGVTVKSVLVEEAMDIARELYVGIVIDRVIGKAVMMASEAGGMDIEAVAAATPEKILRETINPTTGFGSYQARKLAFGMGIEPGLIRPAVALMEGLAGAFLDQDCSLAEINPLVLTSDGRVLALDAKIDFDDNALFRHSDIVELRDPDEEDPLERQAADFHLSYVKLDGTIGCMVNGAGLAMATMDIIKLSGAFPANFLDVGGGATAEQVTNAFRIILSDSNVEAVLINIFGGIARGDVIAEGIIEAGRRIDIKVPLVVRLVGTNAAEGRAMLDDAALPIQTAERLGDAARMVVEAAGRNQA